MEDCLFCKIAAGQIPSNKLYEDETLLAFYDIDPKAPDVAMHNASLNGMTGEDFKVFAGDVLSDAAMRRSLGGGYDVVLANIVADVIIPLAPIARGFVRGGGAFVASGIIEGRQDEVAAAIESAGFEILERHCLEDWHCFVSKAI